MTISYILIFIAMLFIPGHLARLNKKGKLDIIIVRGASWMFGWTCVGFLFALWWAVKK